MFITNIVRVKLDGQMQNGQDLCFKQLKHTENFMRIFLQRLHWTPSNIDCLITHQVGKRPFELFVISL